MKVIQDRTQDILPTAQEIVDSWSADLFQRKPAPAANSLGEFQGTDLDLSTFMSALAQRSAVINIPKYDTMRARTVKANQRVISRDNRHGNILSLYANKEVFSFGVRILDQNVVTQDPETGKEWTGEPRNFTLVNIQGKWHDGWRSLEFSPTAKENDFLKDRHLWTNNSVIFSYFVHPQRWQSFYGQAYFILKALINRLTEEASYLRQTIKNMQVEGVSFPEGYKDSYTPGPSTPASASDKIKVLAFQAEIDHPPSDTQFSNSLPLYPENLKFLDQRMRMLVSLRDKANFSARSVELAFCRHGFQGSCPDMTSPDFLSKIQDSTENLPPWLEAKWERSFVLPGKKNQWNRMVYGQRVVGEYGFGLRYRFWQKTEHVSPETGIESLA
jgi:hypothetical protein